MALPFVRHASDLLDTQDVPVEQLELMTRTLCDGVWVSVGYAFVRRESEQKSSLQLLQGASVEVLRFKSMGCSLDRLLFTLRRHYLKPRLDRFSLASFQACASLLWSLRVYRSIS